MHHNRFSGTITKEDGGYPVILLSYKPADQKTKPLSVRIAPTLGSNMFAMRYGDDDIIYHEPILLKRMGFTGDFVLFPTPNRVAGFSYTWKGRVVPMKKRGHVVEIHGLVFDEPWTHVAPQVKTNCVSVRTSLAVTKHSDMYGAFPFPCTLTLEYILYSNKVTVAYTVKNNGSSPMPFGFGLHPYFSRLCNDDKTLIKVPAASWMDAPKSTLLPTGKLIPVKGKPYDLRKPVALRALNLDHVYTDRMGDGIAEVIYTTLGYKVQLIPSKDFTHYVVYTGHAGAVCIENQTCSTDAINLWNRGYKKESHLLTVSPGRTKKGAVTYAIKPI